MQPLNPAAHNVLGLASGKAWPCTRLGGSVLEGAPCCLCCGVSEAPIHLPPKRPCLLSKPCAEARGDYPGAVASYRRALRLLLGAAHDPHAVLRHPPTAAASAGAPAALQTAVQLNVARALVGTGSGTAAGQLYEELEVTAGEGCSARGRVHGIQPLQVRALSGPERVLT